jgi:hypothetical protein
MMTKKLAVLFSVVLFLVISEACAKTSSTPTDNNSMIESGDKIGDFLITTGVEGNFSYGFNIECSDLGKKNTYSCSAVVGEAINVSTGLYDDIGSGNLDEIWSHSKYQMFIHDHPVDLQTFGTVEYTHPVVGVIRFGNVVVIASKPGKITMRDSGVFDNGDPFASTSTYIFSEP